MAQGWVSAGGMLSILLSLGSLTDGGRQKVSCHDPCMDLPLRVPSRRDLRSRSRAPHRGKGKVAGTGSVMQTWPGWDLALALPL